MGQNDQVSRSESTPPRRGRRGGRRTWVHGDGERATSVTPPPPDTEPPQRTPPVDVETPRPPTAPERPPYEPRRRYPWHDDPDYDPAAHRRTPPPSWPPPASDQRTNAADATEEGPRTEA